MFGADKKNHGYVCTCKRDTVSKNRKNKVSCKCSMGGHQPKRREMGKNVQRLQTG
uniref:Uncharacterized protein n=1 Tax=uncultured marine thaumarchaeote AD1000_41_B03 TaxID=1455915 RepID=A0A075FWM4_9ARCH|nr:hypothetical protein [uncultured marine thaumarchaeote AD1000_41_B03]